MDRQKLIKQLFVGMVSEIIGFEKATELLKEATAAADNAIKASKADVSGSFSRLNDWFDMNAEPSYFGKQLNENLYNDIEAKRLFVKLAKELIDSVRQNDFHFKNMSTVEVLEYLLK